MTQDEIIAMAKQAGCVEDKHYKGEVIFISRDALERFAKLVERRKCQELADKIQLLPFGETASSFAAWVRSEA